MQNRKLKSTSTSSASLLPNNWTIIVNNKSIGIKNVVNMLFNIFTTFFIDRLFYFTYFINVLGAFLAIAMPDINLDGINGTVMMSDVLLFFRSHYQAFFMPLLTVGLGIFERPRLKEFKYSLVGFAAYYVLVLILNGWFTNYDPSVDYFFINSNFIADKLGDWAENLRISTIAFNIGDLTFTYYPIYQVLYFIVYIILSLAMWFIYELAYDVICS
jgi:hypothetical protein